MNRREYLRRTTALLGAGAVAGCLGSSAPGDSTGSETTTTAAGPTVVNQEFSVTRQECGNEVNTARVEEGDGRVTVTGTITGSDPCKTAKLKAASMEDGGLHVVVTTADRDDAGGCAQCLTEIDYEATLSFEGGMPEPVVVVHESLGETRTVANTGATEMTKEQTTNERTTSGRPTVTGSELQLEDQGCGEGTDSASVTFGASDVTVEGTIAGNNTCKIAELREATYDASGDELRVVVGTTDATSDGETPVCGQCIVDIEYSAVVRFEGGLPATVTVVHENMKGSNTVTTASN